MSNIFSREAAPGERFALKNTFDRALLEKVRFGEHGEVAATLPIGGVLQITVGLTSPDVSLGDASVDLGEASNVIRLREDD